MSTFVQAPPYVPKHKIRVVTAASLFDGHDAAINIMRRIIQSTGAEVIHLGHDRSVSVYTNNDRSNPLCRMIDIRVPMRSSLWSGTGTVIVDPGICFCMMM